MTNRKDSKKRSLQSKPKLYPDNLISIALGFLTVFLFLLFVFTIFNFLRENYKQDKPDISYTKIEPEKETFRMHKVMEGESLSMISIKYFNNSNQVLEIARVNKLENPDRVIIGQIIKIPIQINQTITNETLLDESFESSEIEQQKSGSFGDLLDKNSSNSYKIVEGDTLWDVAERFYGDPFKYTEIASLNNIQNPDLIYAGDVLKLPL